MNIDIPHKIKPYLLPAIIHYGNRDEHIRVISEFINWGTDSAGVDLESINSDHIEERIRQWRAEKITEWSINNKIWILKKFFSVYKSKNLNPIKGKYFLRTELGCLNESEIRQIESSLDNYPFVRAAYFFIKHYYLSFSKILSLTYNDVDLNRKIFQCENKDYRFTDKAYDSIKCLLAENKFQKETIFPSRSTLHRHIMKLSDELGYYLTYNRFYQTFSVLNILLCSSSLKMGKNSLNRKFIKIAYLTALRPKTIRTLIQQKIL